jgi:hypothetical protein
LLLTKVVSNSEGNQSVEDEDASTYQLAPVEHSSPGYILWNSLTFAFGILNVIGVKVSGFTPTVWWYSKSSGKPKVIEPSPHIDLMSTSLLVYTVSKEVVCPFSQI